MKKTFFNPHLLTTLILLVFLLPLVTIGQNAIVKGSIKDEEGKEPLIGANIILNKEYNVKISSLLLNIFK